MTFLWAYLAGTLTLINPCVLPLLPIIIAAALQGTRLGPVMLAAGLTFSFTVVGVAVAAFGHLAGIDEQVINRTGAIVMIAFGVILLVPPLQAALAGLASPLASGANSGIDRIGGNGALGQLAIGVLLGAVWSPCVGPTLGGAIGLAASGEGLGEATFTMLMFGLGVSTVLLALAYGSREALGLRRDRLMALMPWAKPIMGAVLLVVGLMIFFHIDRMIDAFILDRMPIWLQDLSVAF